MLQRKNGVKHNSHETNNIFVVFCIIAYFGCAHGNYMGGTGGGSLEYSQGGGVGGLSALSGRAHDYGTQKVNVNAGGVGVGVGVNGVKRVNGRDANVANNGLESSGVAAGEVFVPKTFPLSSQEPTCEQLRAMWIFSKRQSRAAEMTNEIPTYRDPFAFNVWEPFYSSARSLGSVRMGGRERSRLPVFGRIISREPQRPYGMHGQRQRHFGASAGGDGMSGRLYGAAESRPMRRPTQNRYIGGANGSTASGNNGGGSSAPGGANQNSVAVQGSFEKLKELIWTERAKELTQQRRAEEIAARAAVLKEIANGQNIHSSYKPSSSYKADSPLMDENRSPVGDGSQYMNDGRVSIASGQTINPSSKNTQGRASTRSYANRLTQGQNQKGGGSVFSANSATSQSGRNSRLRLPASGYPTEDTIDRDTELAALGVPRTYPQRQSHFRERNRSLFKQLSPADYYRRDVRRWMNARLPNTAAAYLNSQAILPDWNRRTFDNSRGNLIEPPTAYNLDHGVIQGAPDGQSSEVAGYDYDLDLLPQQQQAQPQQQPEANERTSGFDEDYDFY